MSANLQRLTKAVHCLDAVIRRVPADAWDNPSPCEGWAARDVVGHQVGVLDGVANMARGNPMAFPSHAEDVSDPVTLWVAARDGLLEALDQPGSLHHHGAYWFGEMTIDQLIGVVMWDPLTHAWDIAQAAGIDAHLDEDLAAHAFATIGAMRTALTKMRLIGEEVSVPEDADIVSRYLGLVGRNPSG